MKNNGKDVSIEIDGKGTATLGLRVVKAAIKEAKDGGATAEITVSGSARGLVKLIGQSVRIATASKDEMFGKLTQLTIKAGKDEKPKSYAALVGAAADPGSTPTTSRELQDQVCHRLSGSQEKILRALIHAHPDPLAKNELAEQTGQSPTSGGYFNNLSRLRSLGLIDYPAPGQVVALPVLFLQGS